MLAFDNILSLMKKIIILILILVSKNIFAESLEPKCKGNDDSKWTNCYGSISKNGTTYVGKFFNGMMHGKGTFTYSDGATYYGEFKNGEESGKGTFICWQHGAKYVGDFQMAKNMEQVLTTFQMVLTMSGIGKMVTDMEMGFILSKMGKRK